MTWDSIQQIVRILLYSAGSYLFGQAVADGALFQAALAGILPVGAFFWWLFWDRNRKTA